MRCLIILGVIFVSISAGQLWPQLLGMPPERGFDRNLIPKAFQQNYFCSAMFFELVSLDASQYLPACGNIGYLTVSVPLGGQFVTIMQYLSTQCGLPAAVSTFFVGGNGQNGCTVLDIAAETTTQGTQFCTLLGVVGVCSTPPFSANNSNTVTVLTISVSTITTTSTFVQPTELVLTSSTTTSTFSTTLVIFSTTSSGTLSTTVTSSILTTVTSTTTFSSTSTVQSTFTFNAFSTVTDYDIDVQETFSIVTVDTTSTLRQTTTLSSTVESCCPPRTPTFTSTTTTTVCSTTYLATATTAITTRTRQSLSTKNVCGGTATSTQCPLPTTSCLPLGSVQTCSVAREGLFVAYRPALTLNGSCVCKAANGTYQYEVSEAQVPEVYEMVRECLGPLGKVWANAVEGQSPKKCIAIRGDLVGGALEVDVNCGLTYPILCAALPQK